MDSETLHALIDGVAGAVLAILGFFGVRTIKQVDEKFKETQKDIEKHDTRLRMLEQKMVSRDDISRLYDRIKEDTDERHRDNRQVTDRIEARIESNAKEARRDRASIGVQVSKIEREISALTGEASGVRRRLSSDNTDDDDDGN